MERLLSRVDPGRIFEPFVERHKRTIKQYVMELGERGILDELINDESDPTRDLTAVSWVNISQIQRVRLQRQRTRTRR